VKQALVGTLLGFVVGAVLGGFFYSLAYRDYEASGGKTIYYPFTSDEKKEDANKRPWIPIYAWSGVLIGGGLGAVTGSVVGGVGAIVRAIKEAKRSGLAPS